MKKLRLGVKGKVTAVFITLGILLSLSIGYVVYSVSYREVADRYTETASESAIAAAGIINGDSIDGYLLYGMDSEYVEIYMTLQKLKTALSLEYLYVVKPNTETNNSVYIFDIYSEGNDPALISGFGEDSGEDIVYDIVLDTYLTGLIEDNSIITDSEYGWLASAYAPVYASNGAIAAVVGADISMDRILNDIMTQTIQISLISMGAILVFLSVLLFIIGRQILRPILRLSRHMESFDSDEGNLREFEVSPTGDELQTIADNYNRMAGNIRLYMENQTAITADRERIATELSVAASIQASMLPKPITGRDDFEVCALIKSSKAMGGNFYDFFFIAPNRLCVVIADVSGGGIPAVLFMVIAKTMIKNQLMTGMAIDKAMTVLNTRLNESASNNMTVAAFAGVLDISTGLFEYVNAGQNVPLLLRRGDNYEFIREQVASNLAANRNVIYRVLELKLHQGDRLFLYTDGVKNAKSADGAAFGESRVLSMLNSSRNKDSGTEESLKKYLGELTAFSDGEGQTADIGMLVLVYSKGDKTQADVTVPPLDSSFSKVLAFVKKQLNENGLGGAFYAIVAVTVEELFLLVSRLAGGDMVTVRCGVYGSRVELRMFYSGKSYNFLETAVGKDLSAIEFIKSRVSEIYHDFQDGKNVLTMVYIAD